MSEPDYSALRARLVQLTDPEVRLELGEDARRAELASLADEHMLDLIDSRERLAAILYPPVTNRGAE